MTEGSYILVTGKYFQELFPNNKPFTACARVIRQATSVVLLVFFFVQIYQEVLTFQFQYVAKYLRP